MLWLKYYYGTRSSELYGNSAFMRGEKYSEVVKK